MRDAGVEAPNRTHFASSHVSDPELRPGMRCLLTVLNGQTFDWHVDDAQWETALALADKERVLPWFLARMEETFAVESPQIQTLLHQAQRANAVEAFFWRSELKGLLQAFHEEDLPVIPLKGPALAERIYGGVTKRTCQDLDLLVHGHDFVRAQSLLGRLGFAPKQMDGYQQGWVRGAMMVELHCDVSDSHVFDFHIEGAWRGATATTFEGVPTRQFSPEDEYLFLCLHAVRHEFNRLSVVLDIALATHLVANRNEALRPEVRRLRRQGELGYLVARELLPKICLRTPFGEDSNVVSELQPLAVDRIRNVLTRTDTYLSWSARQDFHVKLEASRWHRVCRRCSHLCQMVRHGLTAELAKRDLEFARKWGLARPWQARMLRPFRLVSTMWASRWKRS